MQDMFNKIIIRAIKKQATDIHFKLQKEDCPILFRCQNELITYEYNEEGTQIKLFNYMKYLAGLDLNNRWLPQTGKILFMDQNINVSIRLSYLPSPHSESIVLRLLGVKTYRSLSELSCDHQFENLIKETTCHLQGLFLVSGATGSGKTTTMYAMIDELSQNRSLNIISLEDPIEITKNNCIQVEMNETLGITFEMTLKQVLRHDPDVIVVGEIRTAETAKIAVQCAQTGHLVLATIHAGSAYMTLKRLMSLEINPIDLEDVMSGIVYQELEYEQQRAYLKYDFLNKQDIIDLTHRFIKELQYG